jgi:alkylated DNA nucleotide flippase Atl1
VADDGDEECGVVVESGDGVAEVDGMPFARLADIGRTRRSLPEQGRLPLFRAVMAASQLMAAMGCRR